MAFNQRDLRLIIDGASRIWTYVTLDDYVKDVVARDYFETAASRFVFGDWVLCTTAGGPVILNVMETDPLEMRRT